MNKPVLKLDWCSHKAAKYAVLHWHYSKKMPTGKLVKIGIWENHVYQGVIIFGYGANNKIGSPYKLKQVQICELVRIAIKEHFYPVSKFISIAVKILKNYCSGLRLIVSYADSVQDHKGVIYQAGNWIYTGLMDSYAIKIKGKMIHPKTIYEKYGKGSQKISWLKANLDPKAEIVTGLNKHKYIMPLDKEMRKQIESLSKPYPKRMKQGNDGDQPLSEGATPIHALQTI